MFYNIVIYLSSHRCYVRVRLKCVYVDVDVSSVAYKRRIKGVPLTLVYWYEAFRRLITYIIRLKLCQVTINFILIFSINITKNAYSYYENEF